MEKQITGRMDLPWLPPKPGIKDSNGGLNPINSDRNLIQFPDLRMGKQTLPASKSSFAGFSPLKANVTYTPNQFFDILLKNTKQRAVIRIVSYVLRKTLGWCDKNGNSQGKKLEFTYDTLAKNANVSRRSIHSALIETVEFCYLRNIRIQTRRKKEVSALEICWDKNSDYTKELRDFKGFYAREFVHRTYIPNQFFDNIVKNESIAVTKVVGAIFRQTIGYTATAGFRRKTVRVSFSRLRKLTQLKDQSLSTAIATALQKYYIVRVKEGVFDRNAGKQNKAAVYQINWTDLHSSGVKKTETENLSNRAKSRAGSQGKNVSDLKAKSRAGSQGKNVSGYIRKIKKRNKTLKQQNNAVADRDFLNSYTNLISHGICKKKSKDLVSRFTKEEIDNQCLWLDLRGAKSNQAGLLIRAIENRYPKPTSEDIVDKEAASFVSNYYAAWAGNRDQPIAIPSEKEVQQARHIINRIITFSHDIDVGNLGRRFGMFSRKSERNVEQANKSFVLALRNHGDKFFMVLREEAQECRLQTERRAKKNHKETYSPDYQKYLIKIQNEIREVYPDIYGNFLNSEHEERQRVISAPWMKGEMKGQFLTGFETKVAKQKRFVQFFKSSCQCPVYDFWTWDRNINPDSFNYAGR